MSLLDLHKAVERNTGLLIFGILVVASIGGLVQVLPSTLDESLGDRRGSVGDVGHDGASAPSPAIPPRFKSFLACLW